MNFRCGTTFMAVWNIQSRVSSLFYWYNCITFPYINQFCTNQLLINLHSYTLDDLLKENSYLITLTIRSCFESLDPQCDSSESYTVLNRSILPKTDCVWKANFKHTGRITIIVSDLITLNTVPNLCKVGQGILDLCPVWTNLSRWNIDDTHCSFFIIKT